MTRIEVTEKFTVCTSVALAYLARHRERVFPHVVRRAATPVTTGEKRRDSTLSVAADQTDANKPRRGRKPKDDLAATAAVDASFRDGEEPASQVVEAAVAAPTKAQRGRKLQAAEPETSGDPVEPTASMPKPRADKGRGRPPRQLSGPLSSVAAAPTAAPSPSAPAVQWDAETGKATFNWSAIEQVAGQAGPNQEMARLLLAARAEGASSRWPFGTD